ncbi:MAG: AccI family restriction endonuclease, partial [Hydrocarboniphaga effusa]|nr:AccI family restriction endonuclease [Hydrocarboniphaga effusa]
MHPFERELSVAKADQELALRAFPSEAWLEFWLNPRRLRGSDFLMRWSQGQWSEERLKEAVNATPLFFALSYGPSSVAPSGDVRAFELYFERLEAAGLGKIKKPDLLIFRKDDQA